MKKYICVCLAVSVLWSLVSGFTIVSNAQKAVDITPFDVKTKSALLMEASTGTVLYSKNANEALPPASVTKIMTLLLIMEHIDDGKLSLSDNVTVSEYAASMGGSQVYLESGEEMSVEDMLKSIIIASANDAAVAMAELICGSEEAFVKRMNEKASELGMKNSNFENVTGLDDDTVDHKMSAYDIALASAELINNHPLILKYSCIWMDSIRNGEFGLTNTNRLIRFYKGATGLKTGSTGKAGFCISATAKREGMHLIAVIMGSETRDIRNEEAKALLDYGFANYEMYTFDEMKGEEVKIAKGERDRVKSKIKCFSCVVEKGSADDVKILTKYEEDIIAPVRKGDIIGMAEYEINGELIGKSKIEATENIKSLTYGKIFLKLLRAVFAF